MPNTIRVRHNGGKTSYPSQAKSASPICPPLSKALEKQIAIESARIKKEWDARIASEFTAPASGAAPACIALFDRDDHAPISKVPLTEQEVWEVWKSGGNTSSSDRNAAEHFIASAIREKLARLKITGIGLESAMWQANSFMQMLLEKLEQISTGPSEFRGDEADKFLGGVAVMYCGIKEQLQAAVYAEITAGKPTVSQPG